MQPSKTRETIPLTTQKHNKTRQIVFEATKCGGNAHTALLLLLDFWLHLAGSGGTGHQLRYPSPNIFTPAAFTTPTSHSFLHRYCIKKKTRGRRHEGENIYLKKQDTKEEMHRKIKEQIIGRSFCKGKKR